jgi:hypothetical protein
MQERASASVGALSLSPHNLWEIQKSGLGTEATLVSFRRPLLFSAITKGPIMSTSRVDAEAARTRAIAEALQASGARSLMELLAESERHKEHLDKLCAKLEALPKVIKKKTI